MTVPILSGESTTWHHVIVGTSGKGRSMLLAAEAQRRGITYDELLESLEPSPEEKAAANAAADIRREESRRKEEKRLHAVRNAYLENSEDDDDLFSTLYDTVYNLKHHYGDQPLPRALLKEVLHLLPDLVIGNGIRWGFSDTEVRDDIWTYLHKDEDGRVQALLDKMRP